MPYLRPERPDLRPVGPDGGTNKLMNGQTNKSPPVFYRTLSPLGPLPKKLNRSPKGNIWSAIPVALLCMILNWSKRKQGSGPKGDEVL